MDRSYEEMAEKEGYCAIAGIDEAGRGPLAGPVVAAAAIIPGHVMIEGIYDSKKLSENKRELLYKALTSHLDVTLGIGIVESQEIDRINILQATFRAMERAADQLITAPDYLLIDGNKKPDVSVPCKCVVKGDQKVLSIAAASIIAKVTRDRLMLEYDAMWPQYGFAVHKGYGTKKHTDAIKEHGPCPIHRKSFEPIKSLLVLGESKRLTKEGV